LNWDDHVAPPSDEAMIAPLGPDPFDRPAAKHAVAVGHVIAETTVIVDGSPTTLHVRPSSIERRSSGPSPPATHVAPLQTTDTSVAGPWGNETGLHSPPESVVRSSIGVDAEGIVAGDQPTATQPVAEKHETDAT